MPWLTFWIDRCRPSALPTNKQHNPNRLRKKEKQAFFVAHMSWLEVALLYVGIRTKVWYNFFYGHPDYKTGQYQLGPQGLQGAPVIYLEFQEIRCICQRERFNPIYNRCQYAR